MRAQDEVKTNEKKELWLGMVSIAIMAVMLTVIGVSFINGSALNF